MRDKVNSEPLDMQSDVSVIIVNYLTTSLVIQCIESIFEKTEGINFEIIIADNNSDPDFQAKISSGLSSRDISLIKFIRLKENIGYGNANNKAVENAKGRNLFFLNPDTLLLNNSIKFLSEFLDSHPEAGACCGNLYNEKGEKIFSSRKFLPGVFWDFNELFHGIPQKLIFYKNCNFNNSNHQVKMKFISGADLMIKKVAFEDIGKFSPEFFLYYEDADLCFKLKKKHWKVFNVPAAKIMHLVSQSSLDTNVKEWHKYNFLETGRHIYYKKNLNLFKRGISNLLYVTFLWSRSILARDKSKREVYKERLKFFHK